MNDTNTTEICLEECLVEYYINCSNYYCDSDEEYLDKVFDYVYPTVFEWTCAVLFGVVFVMGLIGNSLVCFVVGKNRSMRTTTNIFIVNLSIGDVMVTILCLPTTVVGDVTETWFLGSAACKIIIYLQVCVICFPPGMSVSN